MTDPSQPGPSSTPPDASWPPAGWPTAQDRARTRPRRRPVAVVISVFGVLGVIVIAVGLTLLVAGRMAEVAGPATSGTAAGTEAPPSLSEEEVSELAQSLEGAHAGVEVDWDAPAHTGEELDPGARVDEAPGILVVETLLGPMMGTGTGIALTADGLAITNYHVVEDSSEVWVTVDDTGERHRATVLGRDAEHDIAVLDIEGAADLDTVSVSLDPVRRGDAVAAIGNGGGQGHLTAVRGEVLGTDRSIMAATEGTDDYSRLTGLVQTDADVIPGYSGGPLVDDAGQVVGVTVAASDGSTTDEVDGFAIPLAVAFDVVEQVLSGEETDTVSIGTDGALGIVVAGTEDGVEVMELERGSAGADIGLVPGDVITAVDGEGVGSSASVMSRLVNDHNVGDRITITWRTADGQEREAEAVLQEAAVY